MSEPRALPIVLSPEERARIRREADRRQALAGVPISLGATIRALVAERLAQIDAGGVA